MVTHYVYSPMQSMVDVVAPDNRVTAGSNLHTSQCIA